MQNNNDLNALYANRTVSLWFKVKDLTSDRQQIIYEENGLTQGLDIYLEDGRLFFKTWNQKGNESEGKYISTDAIANNTWHHVALVLDTSSTQPVTAYLDGATLDPITGQPTSRANVGVGGLLNSVVEIESEEEGYSVKDIKIYERSLDSVEVALLHQPNQAPVATNDMSLTVEDKEIVLFADFLLENDRDPDNDLLKLNAVGKASNGTVSLNNGNNNIIFTPEPNFNGDTSFEYTVSDGRGGTDTGKVNLTVLAETSPILVGTNLHRLADWSPQLPFLNGFKSARQWLTQDINVTTNENGGFVNTWNTGEFADLDLDRNGWVKSLPEPEDDPEYSSVGTILYRDVGQYPGGEYVVLYEGEGTLKYSFDAQKDEAASTPGRDVINVDPTNAGIWLRITETDPNDTGDYLRDIKIMPAEYEYADNQIFNPTFLEKIQPFNTLRFMDWMATNNSTQGEWDNRPTPESAVFSGEIASVESMVELANRTDTDPWFTMPHQATDEYITNFANYVKENLDPQLQIYLEYSNEVWNLDFDQGGWVEEQGINEFSNSNVGDFAKRIDWYSQRTIEITQIWDEVFNTDKERVIGVMSGQAANLWTARRPLEYQWAEEPLDHEEYGIDALSFAPYFGSYLGKPEYEAEIESWIEEEDGGLDKLFQELTTGGLLEDAPQNGSLQQSYSWTENYINLADRHNLDLITYESGQHLRGNSGVEDNQALTNLFISANRDPRMGEIYQEYFTTLDDLGVDLSVNYTDVSSYNKWGSWGILENVNQPSSPKYNVLESLTANNDNNLPPQLGALTNNLANSGLIVEGDTFELNANYTDVGLQDYHFVEFDWGDNSAIDREEQTPLLGDLGKATGNHVYNSEGSYTATLTVIDDDNLFEQEAVSVTVAKKIEIDWKPRSTSQQTSLAGDGVVRVAIFGREDFDVGNIDSTSVRADDDKDALLNGRGVSAIDNQTSSQDINSDGFSDLILVFNQPSLRSVIQTNSDLSIDDNQIYLFGSTLEPDSYFFFGAEE